MNDQYRKARAHLLEVLSIVQCIVDGDEPIDHLELEVLDPLFMHIIDARAQMQLGEYMEKRAKKLQSS